jgi:hypothetical protein
MSIAPSIARPGMAGRAEISFLFQPDLSGLMSLACELIRRRAGEGRNRVGASIGLIFGYKKPGFKTKKNQRGRVGLGVAGDPIVTDPPLHAGEVWRV